MDSAQKSLPWRVWIGSPVDQAERDGWATQIALDEAVSVLSGDSIVFGEIDLEDAEEPTLLITDAQIRRVFTVALPSDSLAVKHELLRRAGPALADALEDARASHISTFGNAPANSPAGERLAKFDAALRAAGRLP